MSDKLDKNESLERENLISDEKAESFDSQTQESDTLADNVQSAQEEKEYDPTLCALCQEKIREDGSFYCEDCRTKMLKTKVKGGAIFAFVMSIIFSLIAVALFSVNLYQAVPLLEGEKQLKQGYANTAANNISAVETVSAKLNKISLAQTVADVTNGQVLFPTGKASNIFVAKVYARSFSVLQAGEYLMQVVGEDAVMKDPAYLSVRGYLKEYKVYAKTSEVVQGYLAQITDPKNIPYDDIIKKIDSNKGKEGIGEHYLEYYKCYLALMAGKSREEQNKYLLNMEKLYPEGILTYGPILADNYYNLGEYDKAIEYADRMIERNLNYYTGHELKFMCYIAQNDLKSAEKVCAEVEKANSFGGVQTGDFTEYALRAQLYRVKGEYDKAMTVVNEGIKLSEGDPELYRQQAILYLLKGNKKEAFKSAENAYKGASYTQTLDVRILNTAVLCAGLVDEKDLYEEASVILEQSSYGINKKVLDCIDGKIDVKDVFSQVGGSEI